MQHLDRFMTTAVKWTAGAAAALAVMSAASTAEAMSVVSTGDGAIGTAEVNWSLTSSPGSTSLTIVSGAADYPGVWVAAPSGSNWITPYAGGGSTATSNAPLGQYVYSLDFENPGAAVTIQWSSDNGATFSLNGTTYDTDTDTSYSDLRSFVIPAADFSSTNEFVVEVNNVSCDGCNNPTGLLVSAVVSPSGNPGDAPLPSALPLLASGVSALGLLAWRKKRKVA